MPASGHQTLSGLLIVTPAKRTGLALTLAPGALGRILVGPQSEERRLTELVVGRPLRIGDLRDQLWADPDRVAHGRRRVERRAIPAERLELRRQHRERFAREAGADLADEHQRPSAIEAHQQRTEMLTDAGRRRVAADHELGLLADLHFAPRARARVRLVRRAFVLGDDPFPAVPLRLAVRGFPIADEAARQEDRTGAPADEALERGAPLDERPGEKR